MKPKFALQRVLDLRARKEESVAIRLAAARAEVDAAREAAEALMAMRQSALLSGVGAGSVAIVGQMQNAAYVLDRLDRQLEDAHAKVAQAEKVMKACLVEFQEATRDRQVLDRLKERKLEAAMIEEADADRKTMDAIALSRFGRGNPSDEGSAQ